MTFTYGVSFGTKTCHATGAGAQMVLRPGVEGDRSGAELRTVLIFKCSCPPQKEKSPTETNNSNPPRGRSPVALST